VDMVNERWGDELRAGKVTHVTAGSRLRQDSVMRGLELVDESCDLIAVHDAVRPLVRPRLIHKAIETAARVGASMLAAPVKATIKRVDGNGIIRETIPRRDLWAAQTPQIFRRELLLRAYREAEEKGVTATDDAELVERLGHDVAIVESTDENLKITTPEDLLIAETLYANSDD